MRPPVLPFRVVAIPIALITLGCADATAPVPPAPLVIDVPEVLYVKGTGGMAVRTQGGAKVAPSELTWSSENPGVLRFSTNDTPLVGTYFADWLGDASVRVSGPKGAGTATVRVRALPADSPLIGEWKVSAWTRCETSDRGGADPAGCTGGEDLLRKGREGPGLRILAPTAPDQPARWELSWLQDGVRIQETRELVMVASGWYVLSLNDKFPAPVASQGRLDNALTVEVAKGAGGELNVRRTERREVGPDGYSDYVYISETLRLVEQAPTASIAGLRLTTTAAVVEKKEDKPAPAGPPGAEWAGCTSPVLDCRSKRPGSDPRALFCWLTHGWLTDGSRVSSSV